MLCLRRLQLKDVLVYQQAEFRPTPGITVVRGENYSGKSLLLNSIPTLRYATPPAAIRKKAAAVVHTKGSNITVEFSYKKKTITVQQLGVGKTIKYAIAVNGKTKQFRTQTFARDYLARCWPLPEELYYSLGHLTAFRNHVLLNGTGPQRHDFFKQVFNLHIYDLIRQQLAEHGRKVQQAEQAKQLLLEQLHELERDKPKFIKQQQLDELRERFRKTSKRREELSKRWQLLRRWLDIRQQLHNEDTAAQMQQQITRLTKICAQLSKQQRKQEAIRAQQRTWQDVQENRQKLQKRLNQLPPLTYKIGSVLTLGYALRELISGYREQLSASRKSQSIKQQLAALRKILPQKDWNEKEYQEWRATRKTESQQIERMLHNLNKVRNQKKCPICQQGLSQSRTHKLTHKFQTQLQQITTDLKNHSGYAEWFELQDDYTPNTTEPTEIIRLGKKVARLYQWTQQVGVVLQDRQKLEQQIKALPKISRPEGKYNPDLRRELDKHQKRLAKLEMDYQVRQSLDELTPEKLTLPMVKQELAQTDKQLQQLYEPMTQDHELLTTWSEQRAAYKMYKKQAVSIANKLDKIRLQAKHAKLYEALLEAYGARGIRTLQVEQLAKVYRNNLNKYAKLLYPDPIQFDVLVQNNEFTIQATRRNKTSDVRYLSGSESRCFVLLSCLALLPFVPIHYRTTWIVLDEMESSMTNKMQRLYAEQFIPALQQIVPTVIIVTPQQPAAFHVPNAHEYLVASNGKHSTITQLKG